MNIQIKVTKEEAQQIVINAFTKRFPDANIRFDIDRLSYSANFGEVSMEIDLFPKPEQLTFETDDKGDVQL